MTPKENRINNLKNFQANKTPHTFPICDLSDFKKVKDSFQFSFDKDESNTNKGVKEFTSFGRITFIRRIGKISFIKVRRGLEDIQLVFKKSDTVDIELQSLLDIFDTITFSGSLGYSSTGEVSVFVTNYDIRQKCLEHPPEKWNGISDKGVIYNQRYLDLLSNTDSVKIFNEQAKIIQKLRDHYSYLLEVDTPVLQSTASGASAKPFETYHAFSKQNMHLRISPELNLKKLMVSNIHEKGVFEIAKTFRNESADSTHNPEFSLMEIYEYSPYSTTEESFDFLLLKISNLLNSFFDRKVVTWSFRDNWNDICKQYPQPANLTMQEHFDETIEDALQREYSTDILVIMHHPVESSPLAKAIDENFSARVEVYLNEMEIINAYVELNDPDVQRKNMEAQGIVDEDYLLALSYGLPETIGIGVGISRLVMASLNLKSIKDVILFPHS